MRILLIIFLFIASSINAHPLHFSLTNIDIADNNIEVSVKFFADDFTQHLNVINGVQYPVEYYYTDSAILLIQAYISKTLAIKFSESSPQYKFKPTRHDEISIWINFNIQASNTFSYIYIDNRMLLDCFMDQTNLLVLSYKQLQKGLQFDAIHCNDSIQL